MAAASEWGSDADVACDEPVPEAEAATMPDEPQDAETAPGAGLDGRALRKAIRASRLDQDWSAMLRHAEELRACEPDSAVGYAFAVTALRRLKQPQAARDMLTEGLARFADDAKLQELQADRAAKAPHTAIEAKQTTDDALPSSPVALRRDLANASNAKDWQKVEMLAARLRVMADDDPQGWLMGARAMRFLKRMRRADELSATGMERFPAHAGTVLERAMVLHRQKRLPEAADAYRLLQPLMPEAALPWARGAGIAVLRGRFDEAEQVVDEALLRFPGDVELLVQRATIAARRQDMDEATRRWDAVRAVAPTDRRLISADAGMALAANMLVAEGDEPPEAEAAPEPQAGEMPDAAVLKCFEGLGGNCEFGLAQRAAGVEPLGLLRFAGITASELVGLLKVELAGVGEPENTTLTLNLQQEYMLADKRFFRSHTFINFGDADETDLLARLSKRTRFLRDKLLAELRKGSKIFLFRPADGEIDDDDIEMLWQAVRSIGPGRLLCVRNAPEGQEAVHVVSHDAGLMVATMPGHASKLSLSFVQSERYQLWVDLCRQALLPPG